MEKRIFLKLDSSVGDELKGRVATTESFRYVEDSLAISSFSFDDAAFDHALLLLGKSPARFGFDLAPYLSTVRTFFDRTEEDQFLFIAHESSTDFKKRYSEDLAVAVASLFMTTTCGVLWDTITQIPQNRKFSKFTPDFCCFDGDGARHIFESKGTTRPDAVDAAIRNAKKQLDPYREGSTRMLAIVSYIASSPRLLPSFVFVVDPPPPTAFLDESVCVRAHYLRVLEYAGFQQSAELFRVVLAEELKAEDQADRGQGTWRDEQRRDLANEAMARELRMAIERAERRTIFEREYVGRQLKIPHGDRVLGAFLGVEQKRLDFILPGNNGLAAWLRTPERRAAPKSATAVARTAQSILQDGTIFLIEQ